MSQFVRARIRRDKRGNEDEDEEEEEEVITELSSAQPS